KTPHAVRSDIGFERARRDLLLGASGEKVMDVALRCGFAHWGRFAVEYRRRYGETPSQTLRRQAVFTAAQSMSAAALMLPSGDRPKVAFGPIDAGSDHSEITAAIADDLAAALTCAGISVTREPRSARYQLSGAIRGSGPEMRLVLRLADNE